MNAPAGVQSVAERLVAATASLSSADIPAKVRLRCEDLLIDVGGLCVAARESDYIRALAASVDAGGPCTAIGHAGGFRAEDAAMIGGTAAHGEDFDDTFEGGPVHSGAVIVPAVLAACERFQLDGRAALLGIASGVETMCRLSLVAPTLIHKAGFHPTSVLGAMAATLAFGSRAVNRGVSRCIGVSGCPGASVGRRYADTPARRFAMSTGLDKHNLHCAH